MATGSGAKGNVVFKDGAANIANVVFANGAAVTGKQVTLNITSLPRPTSFNDFAELSRHEPQLPEGYQLKEALPSAI